MEQVDEEVRGAFAVLPHEGLESSLLWNVASATLLNLQVTKSTEKYPKVLKSTKNDSKVPEVPRSTNCSSVPSWGIGVWPTLECHSHSSYNSQFSTNKVPKSTPKAPRSSKSIKKYQKYQLQFCRLMRDWSRAYSGMSLSLTWATILNALLGNKTLNIYFALCGRKSREGGDTFNQLRFKSSQSFGSTSLLLCRARSASWGSRALVLLCSSRFYFLPVWVDSLQNWRKSQMSNLILNISVH